MSSQPSASSEKGTVFLRIGTAKIFAIATVIAMVAFVITLYFYYNTVLCWLDAKKWRSWVPAIALFAMLFFSAWAADWRKPKLLALISSGRGFALLLFVALIACRWTTVTYNQQLSDPDESQILAGAITLLHDPVFFRSVDGTTHGPIDQLPYILPGLFGLPIDYFTGRLVLLLINWFSLVMVWQGLRTFLPERMARLSILPAWTLYALAVFDSVIQVGSEDVPAMLVAAALCMVLKTWQAAESGKNSWHYTALTGLVLGAVPFAKLQGMPPAAWLGAIACVVVLTSKLSPRGKASNLLSLFLGTAAIPLLVFLMLATTGMLNDFYEAYIKNNILYAQQKHHSYGWILTHFFETARSVPGYRPYFIPITIAAAIGLPALLWVRKQQTMPVVVIIGYCLCSLYAMIAPGKTFFHYPRIYFVAATTLAGVLVSIYYLRIENRGLHKTKVVLALLFIVGTLLPQFVWIANEQWTFRGSYRGAHKLKTGPAADLIIKYAEPGDTLAQWGWEPAFFVKTRLPQGTRDGHTQRQIEGGEQQAYYRARFIEDMKKNRPRFFIDTVGGENFGYKDRATLGHEICAPLNELVQTDYNLIGDIEGTRIYIKKRASQDTVSMSM